jgi:hypothetical protein
MPHFASIAWETRIVHRVSIAAKAISVAATTVNPVHERVRLTTF